MKPIDVVIKEVGYQCQFCHALMWQDGKPVEYGCAYMVKAKGDEPCTKAHWNICPINATRR